MRIGNISGTGAQGSQPVSPGIGQPTDSYSKNLQNQIENAQKRLQELSANTELSAEDKMKKRQEIIQEISSLQNQLRNHERELRKQEQQKDTNNTDASGGSMQAMISADISMEQAQVQGRVKSDMRGRAGVLKAEIKLDGAKGQDTSAKEDELVDVEQKMTDAARAQVSTLRAADEKMKEASKEEATERTEDKDSSERTEKKKTAGGEVSSSEDSSKEEAVAGEVSNRKEDVIAAETEDNTGLPVYYRPVDIRL